MIEQGWGVLGNWGVLGKVGVYWEIGLGNLSASSEIDWDERECNFLL